MDPNATLAAIDEFLTMHQTGDEVDEMCRDLWIWIGNGGFEPDWGKYDLGTSYYRCRKIHMDRGED